MTEQEWRDRFGARLASLIKKKGCTQGEFAEEIGVSESTISHYIDRKRAPKATVLVNIARVLGCDLRDLIDFGENVM